MFKQSSPFLKRVTIFDQNQTLRTCIQSSVSVAFKNNSGNLGSNFVVIKQHTIILYNLCNNNNNNNRQCFYKLEEIRINPTHIFTSLILRKFMSNARSPLDKSVTHLL